MVALVWSDVSGYFGELNAKQNFETQGAAFLSKASCFFFSPTCID